MVGRLVQSMEAGCHCLLGMSNCSISPRGRFCLALDCWHARQVRQEAGDDQWRVPPSNETDCAIDFTMASRRQVVALSNDIIDGWITDGWMYTESDVEMPTAPRNAKSNGGGLPFSITSSFNEGFRERAPAVVLVFPGLWAIFRGE